jgi:nucleoside-diphosphate-sugar epimerase
MSGALPKVLVTGGTGYIGRHFLERLRAGGTFEPVALARPTSDTAPLYQLLDSTRYEDPVRIGDLLDPDSLANAVRGVRAVVALAADMDFFPRDPSRLVRVNVEGATNLLRACAAEATHAGGGRIRFLYVSSTEAVGRTDDLGRPAAETDRLSPDCEYGRSKAMAEAVALSREFEDSLDVCVLRPTGVYGPAEQFFFQEMCSMVGSGLLCVSPGPLSGRVMFSHVDDVCDAIMLALEADSGAGARSRCYNVCPDDSVTYREVSDTIAVTLGRSKPLATVPLGIACSAMELLAPLLNLGKRRVFMCHPESLLKTMTTRVYSNALIKRELGYAPRACTLEGVRETVEGEVQAGRIQKSPVSPLLLNATKAFALMLFGLARLWLSQASQGSH